MNTAAAQSPNPLERIVRVRPDLEWSEFSEGRPAMWVARDPISLQYFHFNGFERAIVGLLNGRHSLAEVLERVVHSESTVSTIQPEISRATPQVTPQWLLQFVARLESACLTVSRDAVRSGRLLWAGKQRTQGDRRLRGWLSPLVIRLKGFDPTGMLNVLAPVARILFSRACFVFWAFAAIIVGSSVGMRLLHDPVSLTAPLTRMTVDRALGWLVLYVIVKSLHELGHALACKKWNAECHEIGVLLIAFMPCLYCDTSDSWKLSSRRRAAIAAAGVYVEICLAVIAGSVWLVTKPDSALNLLAAGCMVLCSLSTVLVNANPLLRYDGYYVLSDLWRVPNLHEQSREAMRAMATSCFTGERVSYARLSASTRALAAYALAACVYRYLVVATIAWFVWSLLDGMGLSLLGAALVIVAIGGLFITDGLAFVSWLQSLLSSKRIRPLRAGCAILIGSLAIYLFFGHPFPSAVTSRGVASFADCQPIYAEHAGRLASFQTPGTLVAEGDVIVRIASPELELELLEARGQVALEEQRAEHWQKRLVDDGSAPANLAVVLEELAQASGRERILRADSESLACTARRAGMLLPGERRPPDSLTSLPDQHNTRPLLSPENIGCFVNRGALLGWLCDRSQIELTAYVNEADAELLRAGMAFHCRWDSQPGHRLRGTVNRISSEPVTELPEALIGDRNIAYTISSTGAAIPDIQVYAAYLELEGGSPDLNHNSLGTVHIATESQTLFQSLRRFVEQNLRPHL